MRGAPCIWGRCPEAGPHPGLPAGSVLLSVAELHWRSSSPAAALPALLQALALSREYRLQYLASETVLNLAFAQVSRSCLVLFCFVLAHICSQELASLALLLGFEKDNTELPLLNIEAWGCSLRGRPCVEVWSCGPGDRDTSQGHWPRRAACLVKGTRLFIEDTCILLMISWPRAMLDLTRGWIE